MLERDVELFIEHCELKGVEQKDDWKLRTDDAIIYQIFQRTGDRADGEGDAHDGTELYQRQLMWLNEG